MWKIAHFFASVTAAILSFVGLIVVVFFVFVFAHFVYLLLKNEA